METIKRLGMIEIFVIFFLTSCIKADEVDPGPSPPPTNHGTEEIEPNNHFTEAGFLGVLPIISPRMVYGNLSIFPYHDVDFFQFYIAQPEYVEEIYISIVVETDLWTVPKVKLFQTTYDNVGAPTGNYTLIGQYVQGPGLLFVDRATVPHDMLENNDLFIVLEVLGDPYYLAEYELEYWTN